MWQKLKWLFSSKIELVEVDNLNDENRGGFSSTGVK
jgi:dUTPase